MRKMRKVNIADQMKKAAHIIKKNRKLAVSIIFKPHDYVTT